MIQAPLWKPHVKRVSHDETPCFMVFFVFAYVFYLFRYECVNMSYSTKGNTNYGVYIVFLSLEIEDAKFKACFHDMKTMLIISNFDCFYLTSICKMLQLLFA